MRATVVRSDESQLLRRALLQTIRCRHEVRSAKKLFERYLAQACFAAAAVPFLCVCQSYFGTGTAPNVVLTLTFTSNTNGAGAATAITLTSFTNPAAAQAAVSTVSAGVGDAANDLRSQSSSFPEIVNGTLVGPFMSFSNYMCGRQGVVVSISITPAAAIPAGGKLIITLSGSPALSSSVASASGASMGSPSLSVNVLVLPFNACSNGANVAFVISLTRCQSVIFSSCNIVSRSRCHIPTGVI